MSKRRKRDRTRAGHQNNHCDTSELRTLTMESPKPANLLPKNPTGRRSGGRPNAARILVLLLDLLSIFALVMATNDGSQIEPNSVPNSPVILRSEQKQLFKGLHHRESAIHQAAQDVISFLGIRYASAPMRRLRFMPPTPFNYAPNQVHDARHFGHICMQRFPVDFNSEQRALLADLMSAGADATASANKSAPAETAASRLRAAQLELMERLLARPTRQFRQLLELDQSEDCLNLDIHVPFEATKPDVSSLPEVGGAERRRAEPSNLRPVLVVIHGESFDYGASATISGARRFASLNGLLVVTFNYRLNLLGFPPRLASAKGSARGNLGLLDQVALLHWLQANIRSFGGAPRNVTLLGTGTGALFVNLLMVSPLAKGLFQRAIIEGASALSPTLANSFPQQQQVGLQHLRLLATMADCSSGPGAMESQHLGGRNSSADDLRRYFECLKTSPAETLVQPIPFGLLDSSAAPGELALARRWHRPLELLLRNLLELDQSLVGTEARRNLNELANRIIHSEEASQQPVQLTASQLNRLIVQLLATRRSIGSQSGASDLSVQRASELLDELLGAIYLPSNESLIATPFGAQLEPGTLLIHDELDLISSMLQSQSQFGQQDLLIGSPKPLLDFNAQKSSYPDDAQLDETAHSSKELPNFLQPPFDDLVHPNERFAARTMRHTGLTDEQAIQQVGLFVRTHFRYHQQEIANSIISNYFLSDQFATSSQLNQLTVSNRSDPSEVARVKQMQLLKSLVGAFEDSLANVPLVRTALVHSMKQLETLADLFVRQQIYRLNELVKQAQQFEVPKLLADEQRKLAALDVDFLHFAQQLYNETTMWPLDELWSSNETSSEQQAHSTYFYQLESPDWLVEGVKSVLKKVEQKSADENRVGAKAMDDMKRNLRDNLLKKFANKGHLVQQPSLGCALFGGEKADDGDIYLLDRLLSLICNQMGQQVIANFVISGNVNRGGKSEGSANSTFAVQVEQYEMECTQAGVPEQPDHHSVQPGGPQPADHSVSATGNSIEPASTSVPSLSCRQKLDDLTLEYLLAEFASRTEEKGARSWPVFNLFSQQLASIDGLRAPIWSAGSLSESRGQARDRFDRKIAFWANFLPTLNCSRTQPLGANALARANNSSLLNMNLDFSCHQGPRTAGSLLQTFQAKIKTNVADWIGGQLAKQQQLWTNGNVNTLSTQNHHSLRMATGNESQLDELNLEAERKLNRSAGGWLPPQSVANELPLDGRLVWLFSSSSPLLVVWMICGSVLVGSMLLAGGCALAHRYRKGAPEPTDRKRPPAGETNDPMKFAPVDSIQTLSDELLSSNGPYLSQPFSQPSDQFANYHDKSSPLEAQRRFLEYPLERQQQTREGAQETILLPIISTPHYYAPSCHQEAEPQYQAGCHSLGESNDTNTSQITPEQKQQHQQQQMQVLSSGSDTTTITNRPQSSVSLVSASTNTTNQTNVDTNGSTRQQACKKRVKISDPKRLLEVDYILSHQQQQQQQQQELGSGAQMYLNGNRVQMASALNLTGQPADDRAHFCPVHRASSSNYLVQSNAPLDYEASTAFLTNEPSEGTRYLELLEGTQASFGCSDVAIVGSLADYLNLLTPHQEGEMLANDAASKSLHYNSQPRANKRRQTRQNSSGLCKMHSGQTVG